MELKRIITKFTYRIEPKPEGGFIAHASDPSLPPLEAPTRLELQQKIQANIGAALAEEFPGLKLSADNQQLKFDFHIEAKPGGGFIIRSHDPNAQPIEGASHDQIEHPFAEKLAGVIGKYLVPELTEALAKQGNSGDIKVLVNRTLSVTTQAGSHKLTLGSTQGPDPSGSVQALDAKNTVVIKGALERVPQLDLKDIEDVILGCAMPEAEQGMNVARIASLRAGLPVEVSAMTINRFCSSGLQAIAMAAERIGSGGAEVIVAGGTESMSMIPMGGHKISPNP